MAGIYERRQSKAAIWCLRLAVIAIPFFILTIFLHRSQSITTRQAFFLISFGLAIIIASLVFGLKAAADLWEKGYKGGRATVNGIVLSTLLLIPFGIELVKALDNPQINDVSTDVVNPPAFLDVAPDASSGNKIFYYDDYVARQIVSNYPALVARRYDAPPERVIVSVLAIFKRWGWKIQYSQNLPKINSEDDQTNQELAGDETELQKLAPATEESALPDILLQVSAQSFIMKLKSKFIIRLSAVDEATIVDARSASDWGPHDFASNAEHITQFLASLDEELAGLAGE